MALTEEQEENIARKVAMEMDDEVGLSQRTTGWWPIRFAVRFLAALPDYKAQRNAKRWEMVETLMFLGNIELNQDEDGGYSILLEPAENIVAQRWTGNSPEEAIDAAIASVKGGA